MLDEHSLKHRASSLLQKHIGRQSNFDPAARLTSLFTFRSIRYLMSRSIRRRSVMKPNHSKILRTKHGQTSITVFDVKSDSCSNAESFIKSPMAPSDLAKKRALTDIVTQDVPSTGHLDCVPTPLKRPRFPLRSSSIVVSEGIDSKANICNFDPVVLPFRPEGDKPKARSHSVNFNFMRQEPDAERAFNHDPVGITKPDNVNNDDIKSELDSNHPAPREAASLSFSRTNKLEENVQEIFVRQEHALPGSDTYEKEAHREQEAKVPQSSKQLLRDTKTPKVTRRTGRGCVSPDRVKKERKVYQRVPHDRSKGLSMSRNAVDYRLRKNVQSQYRNQLVVLIDGDIVNEVENEGGITPLGRLFKAAVRMLERVQGERAQNTRTGGSTERFGQAHESQRVNSQTENLKRETSDASEELVALKQKLRALLSDPE